MTRLWFTTSSVSVAIQMPDFSPGPVPALKDDSGWKSVISSSRIWKMGKILS